MDKKVLLVEDDPNMVIFMENLIKELKYDIEVATDGMQGLEMARRLDPSLIILDIMLPKLDGFKISRYLKFDDNHSHIPILMLTAKSDAKDREIGRQTGADAYLTKPFDKPELINTIKDLIA